MAKEKETEAQLSKLDEKREKAEAKKKELEAQIEELKAKIADEKDEKVKKKLRKTRDELMAQKDGIVISDDKVKVPMAASAKKALQACIAIVVVVAICLTYVATGAARKGFISSLGWPQKVLTGMVLTDNDGKKHSIKVSTYNFYFATYYNNMQSSASYLSQLSGSTDTEDNDTPDFDVALSKQTRTDDDGNVQTWAEYYEEQVLDSIKSTYAYYYAALKANDGKEPEITEDQQKELDETIDKYKESADSYGFTVSAYLTAAMGDGVDEKVFRNEAKIQYIAENYQKEYTEELNKKEYSEEEYNTYLDEHKDELVSVDVKYFEATNEDDAIAFVAALKADGSNFAELAAQYASEDEKEQYADPVETTYYNLTRSTLQGIGAAIAQADEHEETEEEEEEEHEHTYSGLDWLYSEDRKAGEAKNVSTSVVYIINPVSLSEVHPVTVRHILITPDSMKEKEDEDTEDTENTENTEEASEEESEEETLSEEELDKLASDKAQEILDEYRAGEQTADAFAALAKQYSTDSNASSGGIYENVVPNQMVSTFNAWIFDSARKEGDTAIVKTEYGYHVMYFESTSDMPVWKYTAQQALASEDSSSLLDEFMDANTIKKSWPGSCYFEKDTDIDN